MKPKIVVIIGHPHGDSYCAALATAYIQAATKSGASVRVIDLSTIQFDPNLRYGYHQRMELEEDLIIAREAITWADHLVFVYPTWWGTMPAILKGFIDRTFLPGFAFKYRPNSMLWDKLLKGKSAHLIVTMDTPSWYNRFVYKQAGHRVMKRATLQFCGVNPVRVTDIGPVKSLSNEQRQKWITRIEKLGSSFA
ncbi:NAD(P)H-dependent oxidoreductase [Paenibacillus crassostreae]|uniref:NADPH:quinone reductase n=1 Tax=Paenibacillus crassostreae TaxID=1763538 RepID=A0A167GJE3_9BACL|nr:NAD(P)H-dependent oxidoreductase [Paenibacillus crassostreae]AOZ92167.1 NADPH:quinone reductase [Paenibacillus crassostreae]OAB77627.1 NADPH:quinone reductase [Paenibacillus crassostreae]